MTTPLNGQIGTAAASSDAAGPEDFEKHRRHLTGLAYRMLGSIAEAEDAVQEAYIRWHGARQADIANPRAFLSKTVTRICLDQMKSARARRETYVGPWLPEPVLEAETLSAETASEYAADLAVGLMLALERLSPLERAAFLLHDVFDVGFDEVAELLGRTEAACRQLAARARANVRAGRPRFTVRADQGETIVRAFMGALQSGSVDGLARVRTADALLYSDGGGKRKAALNPIRGRDRILRFMAGVLRKLPEPIVDMQAQRINGVPGLVITRAGGDLQTIALETARGEITAIYSMRNPDKLKNVARQMGQIGERQQMDLDVT